MKKRLESELISIAHRILKLKNKSELFQLHSETQKLYETLSVLKFVEENINIVQPKIDVAEIEFKIEKILDNNNEIIVPEVSQVELTEEKLVAAEVLEETEIFLNNKNQEIVKEEILIEKEEEIETFIEEKIIEEKPIIIESIEEEIVVDKKKEPVQISFEDFQFDEPVFEKISNVKPLKPATLNEKLSKGLNIGINDRIGFVKHLFGDSNEDFNRVLSQLATFDTFVEAKNFIEEMVKPDYNDWKDQDEFSSRFMELLGNKFL
jgi:hypothetical protein